MSLCGSGELVREGSVFSILYQRAKFHHLCYSGKLSLEKGKFVSALIEVRLVMKLRQLFLQKVSILTKAALETFDLFI